jgi:hypothetical protein
MALENLYKANDTGCGEIVARVATSNTSPMGNAHQSITPFITSTLPRSTKRALDTLSLEGWLKGRKWYLAGGTALAMHLGHRKSVDLDFFTTRESFSTNALLVHLKKLDWITDRVQEGTVYGRLSGAKVSFIAYPFFVPRESFHAYGTIHVLSPKDSAVMKVIAISQRGRKRDFVDLFWYASKEEPLKNVLRRLPEQYPSVAHDYHHILKSLMYFTDAEEDPMPNLRSSVSWTTVKKYFQQEVPRLTKELIELTLQ